MNFGKGVLQIAKCIFDMTEHDGADFVFIFGSYPNLAKKWSLDLLIFSKANSCCANGQLGLRSLKAVTYLMRMVFVCK